MPRKHLHIGSIDYVKFYRPLFSNIKEVRKFIDEVENSETKAKLAIHQAARMLWLADRIEKVARGRPALQILFYLIAAEAVAKIVFNFKGKNSSKKYVRKFFLEICSSAHHTKLKDAFSIDRKYLNLEESINFLYKIRCDVVHEAKYYDLHFNDYQDKIIPSVSKPRIRIYISTKDVRKIVLEGAIVSARSILKNNYPLNAE